MLMIYGNLSHKRYNKKQIKKMDIALKDTIERLKQANNILVTVSRDPSVDQLSAVIGLTLLLNKLDKHATAVFSGAVPSAVEFLEPHKTIEKNTDSLRDFIISLDKSKADKLRYKVEDKVVKIFITPYRTSITDQDLVFSQGDFNVEVVMALGVHERDELDEAITAHGRILHDATVICVNTQHTGGLGAINWVDPKASSLCEMLVSLGNSLKEGVLDSQIANAFLTGIVAETERFSNDKTSSETMSISSKLIAAGANQQLVASKLQEAAQLKEEPQPPAAAEPNQPEPEAVISDDGSLKVPHGPEESAEESATDESAETAAAKESDENYELPPVKAEIEDSEQPEEINNIINGGSSLITEPPSLGGTLTANSKPEALDPAVDPLGANNFKSPLLSRRNKEEKSSEHDASAEQPVEPAKDVPTPEDLRPDEMKQEEPKQEAPQETPVPEEIKSAEPRPEEQKPAMSENQSTLADLENTLQSPHINQAKSNSQPPIPSQPAPTSVPDSSDARGAVSDAIASQDQPTLQPLESLNAKELGVDIPHDEASVQPNTTQPPAQKPQPPDSAYGSIHIDPKTGEIMFPPHPEQDQSNSGQSVQDVQLPDINDVAAPSAPPPMMPPPPIQPPDNGNLPPPSLPPLPPSQ